jgi:hypothetical protein
MRTWAALASASAFLAFARAFFGFLAIVRVFTSSLSAEIYVDMVQRCKYADVLAHGHRRQDSRLEPAHTRGCTASVNEFRNANRTTPCVHPVFWLERAGSYWEKRRALAKDDGNAGKCWQSDNTLELLNLRNPNRLAPLPPPPPPVVTLPSLFETRVPTSRKSKLC